VVRLVVAADLIGRALWNISIGTESPCLSLTCAKAMVTRGAGDKVMVTCNFAGAMRGMNFTVLECTGFLVEGSNSKLVKLVKIEGFAPDKHEVHAMISRPISEKR